MADAIEQPGADTPSGYASVTHQGMTIESNTESADQIRESFEKPKEPEPVKEPPTEPEKPAQPAADETTERNEDGTYKKRNRRDDPQEAVKSAIAKQREAERERDALKAELETARRPRQEPAPPAPETDKPKTQAEWARYKAMPDAPKLDQFETIEDYNFAVGVFVAEKLADAREAKAQERTSQESLGRAWQTALTNARAKDPEFDSKVNQATPISLPMRHVIMNAGDLGPALLLYLSEHQDDAQRISTLHPSQALEEMGSLKGYLKAQADAATQRGPAPQAPVSEAKPPKKPLGTSPIRASDDAPGDDASDAEHEAYWGPRRAKLRAR